MSDSPVSLSRLPGVWHRSLLVGADGVRDTTTTVTWVQGPARYADLRQPAGHPARSGAASLAALGFPDLIALTRQEAFAGRLRKRGDVFHWARLLDFGPVSLPDAGRLRHEDGVLVETGEHVPYVEHWQPERTGGPFAALELLDPATGSAGLLVRAGSWFGYVRDRAEPVPADAPLEDLVRGADGLERARGLVDFELSLGRIADGRWTIARSTLPHRTGARLAPALDGCSGLRVSDTDHDASPYTRTFEITAAEGPLDALHSPAPVSEGARR
ncbi:hypothetical protein [Streptomyces sp. NBC_01465]|uniref:hypothetical protein n=1 Tax=Streptomyces sp. NBC_01465 TaxID=2903878 RepID=UPI002E32492E|nr:hypothetical protein [Streptomyces sp. NBC_01465]